MTSEGLQDDFWMTSGYLQDIFRKYSGYDDFRMTQKIQRRLSESNQRARQQSDFVILSEPKILHLVV